MRGLPARAWDVVALAAGLVAALGLAPLHVLPALWIAFPALVLVLDAARTRWAAARAGWLFGTGYFLGGLWWIGDAFFVDGGWLLAVMPFAVLGLAAGLGLFFGLGTFLAFLLWSPGPARILALAAGLGVSEALRGRVLTGFPWNGFGQMLAGSPLLMQPAALVGAEGLGILVVLVGALPAVFLGTDRRGAGWMVAAAGVLVAGGLGYGAVRLAGPGPESVPGLVLRLVQPSVPQETKWQIASRDAIFDTLLELSRGPVDGDDPDARVLVIWPESSVPFLLQDAPVAREVIADALPPHGALLAGAVRRGDGPEGDERFFNALLYMDRRGALTDVYDKLHLVPFGEYVPFASVMNRFGIDPLAVLPGGFSAGEGERRLVLPGVPEGIPLICYEAIFPGIRVPDFLSGLARPDGRAGWILNVTNDAWFGETPGPLQHFAQARLRAVEEGLPLVRVGNTGVTAVVDAAGRIHARLPMGAVARLDATLPEAGPETPFARLGAIPAAGAVVVCAALAWNARRRRLRIQFASPD
ncbi:apolipoprotein N-acyltransferase [Segnochrobactraceae bacterium EtOH-i3]